MPTPYRILIAEDDADQCAVLVQTVQMIYPSASVMAVTDGNAALASYRDHGADVVITDQRMPGLIGTALVQQLRVINPLVSVILMSGLIGSKMTTPGKRMYYLQKPVSVQELTYVLQEALT